MVGKSPNGPRLVNHPRCLEREKIFPIPSWTCSPITWPPGSTSTEPRTATACPITSAPSLTCTLPPTATVSPWTTLPDSSSMDPPTQTASPWTICPWRTVMSPWNTRTTSPLPRREEPDAAFTPRRRAGDIFSISMPAAPSASGVATTTSFSPLSTPMEPLCLSTCRSASRGSASLTSTSIRSLGDPTSVIDQPAVCAIRCSTSAVGTFLAFSVKRGRSRTWPESGSTGTWSFLTLGIGGMGGMGGTGGIGGRTSKSEPSSVSESLLASPDPSSSSAVVILRVIILSASPPITLPIALWPPNRSRKKPLWATNRLRMKPVIESGPRGQACVDRPERARERGQHHGEEEEGADPERHAHGGEHRAHRAPDRAGDGNAVDQMIDLGVQRPADDGEEREREGRERRQERVPPGDELRLPHLHCGEHGGGEVSGRIRVPQRGELAVERGVDGQLAAALRAAFAVLAGAQAFRAAERAVRQGLELGVGQVAHDRCSESCAFSSLRARCSQVITVPMGTRRVSAISA